MKHQIFLKYCKLRHHKPNISTVAFQELSLFQEAAVAQLKQSVHNELLSSKNCRLLSVDFQRHKLYAAAYIQEKCREIFIFFSFPLTHALSVSLIMLTPTAKLRTRHLIPDNFAIFLWHKPTQMHPAQHTATHQEENAAYPTVWGEKLSCLYWPNGSQWRTQYLIVLLEALLQEMYNIG